MKTMGAVLLCLSAFTLTRAGEPVLVTAQTRADARALAELERPGDIFFSDDFESEASLKKYYEIRGQKEGHAKLVKDAKLAHAGNGAIQFTAVNCDNPHFPAYRSGHRLFQRPSPRKQIPSNNRK